MSVTVGRGLAERIASVLAEVSDASRESGRRPEDITVVAVSKTVGRQTVEAAWDLGLRHFGENRVQEAARKFSESLPPGATLHFIGQLQSNKARPALALFDIIESVDRPSLIAALEGEAERSERVVPVLLQVNVAREPQKAGCPPEAAPALLSRVAASPWLRAEGLMTMAPLVADPEDTRPIFAGLRELRDALRRDFPREDLGTLSMGMSDDFRVAIAEGATSVRIGRAIFGPEAR
jgi:pyridoxal phosphate enzyme (YggS family)